MRRSSRLRVVLFGGIILISQATLSERADACEVCGRSSWLTPWNYLCRPAKDKETGATGCTDNYEPVSNTTSCFESGDYCTVIIVNGGGTGGGGGGEEENPCQTSNFCPAECFSCSGGGGRPAV
ncbi:MAG TPA: hypothetical protein VF789_31610 [Thermoanaerobaculia bacterium]